MQYEISQDVEKVASGVIKEHLPELKSKTIVYVTQDKKDDKTGNAVPQMRKGKPIIGDIKIIDGLNAFLISGAQVTDYDGPTPIVALIVSRHAWEHLQANQREAWLHQQLVRLEYDDKTGKPSVGDFDVKEMTMTAKLYGPWSDDLQLFLKTAKQHPLFEDLENQPVQPSPAETAAPAEKREEKNGKAKVEKAAKPNGNGKDKSGEAPKPSGLASLKDEVARRRGGKPAATRN